MSKLDLKNIEYTQSQAKAKPKDENIKKMVEIMKGIYDAAVELEEHFINVSKSVYNQNEKIAVGEEILMLASSRMQQSKHMAQRTRQLKRAMDKRNCFFSTVIVLVVMIGAGCSIGYTWSLFDKT